MKYLLPLLFLALIACKKEDNNPAPAPIVITTPPPVNGIVDTWHLNNTWCWLSSGDSTGTQERTFYPDSTQIFVQNGDTVWGTYSLSGSYITYDFGATPYTYLFEVFEDSLLLHPTWANGACPNNPYYTDRTSEKYIR